MAAKKTTAKDVPTQAEVAEQAAKNFAHLRSRALQVTGQNSAVQMKKLNQDEYVLGPEDGFDPPIRVPRPDLATIDIIDEASRTGDLFGTLRALMGKDNWRHFLAEISPAPNPEELVLGLSVDILEHFFGKDALSSILGGSTAS